MKIRINCLMLLLCFPLLAQAEAYKCKQPDGSLSFQDQPCPSGAISSALNLPVTSAPVEPAGKSKAPNGTTPRKVIVTGDPVQDRDRERQRRQAEDEIRAQNQETKAFNQMQRCNYARQQLGVLKEARPVFRRDDKGERQYVKDENRQTEIAAAEQRVAEACR
jgi:hypothetical protein